MSGYNVTIGSTSTNVTVGYRPTLGVTQQAYGIVGPAGPGIGTTSSINTTGIITASYFVGNGSLLTNVPGGGGNSGYANTAGIATYATNAGVSTYATSSGIATYATNAGVSTYATSAGIATYATSAGITTSGDYAQSGATSAYATKRVLQYNETTKAVTYSNTLDAVRAYITGYGPEIHVSPVAFDDTGNGTIGDPVKTIARAQVLATLAFETTGVGERKTIILHPGDYAENVTIDTQFTVLTTHELVGKNTTLSGTLTITKGCTIDGLKMNNLVISATSATGSVDIIGCTVTTATTKTSSAYTVFRGCDLSSSSLSITGTGTVILIGGNYFTVTVNNAAAAVLSKAVVSMGPVTLTAGTLQLSDTLVYSATNTSNAITQSAGSVLTLNNSQTLIPTLTNVARNSFGGFYSILHSVYDKPNSTFGGTSLNSISYSQYINVDRIGIGTTNATSSLYVVGDEYVTGVVTATTFYGTFSGNAATATFATSSGIATFATNAGIATYATTSGVSTNVIGGIASVTSLSVSGIATLGVVTAGNIYSTGIITATSINFASGGVLGDLYTDGGIGIGLKASPANYYAVVASNNLQQYLQVDDNYVFVGTGYASTTGNYNWVFDKNGALTFPDNTIQYTAFTGYASTAGIATYATSSGIATYATNAGIATFATTAGYATTAGISTVAQGLTGTPNISVGIITATDYRIQSVAEKTTLVNGNTVSLVYNTGGGNVAICTNPSGNITLNVTGIPTDSAFDNYSLAFSVIVTNTGTARSCTAINLNGVSETILWFGGSLSAAISGVTTSNGYDVYSFTGINTVGSASTTANYIVLGSVNGSYR
jgi:hypothetical protein